MPSGAVRRGRDWEGRPKQQGAGTLRILGKEEEATPTLTAWEPPNPCPASRNTPGGIRARTAVKDLIRVRAPVLARPSRSRGNHCRSGGKGDGNGSGGGSPPPLPSRTGRLCSRQRPWPDTCEAAELSERRWVKTWRRVPRPRSSPAALGRGWPLRQLGRAHLSAGRTAEIRLSGPRVRLSSKHTSPPPAQDRISKHAALHTPRLAPGSESGGMAGRRGAPRPAAP